MATEDGDEENSDQILYDLLVQAEWQLEAEPLSKTEQEFWKEKGPLHWKLWRLSQISLSCLLQTAKNSIRLKTSFGCPPTSFANILSGQLPWNFALSRDGKLLAVLRDKSIEVRSWKDSFTSLIAKCEVGLDPFPQWRKITWNRSGSMLAMSSSFGDIRVFDTSCSLLYKIKQHVPSMNLPTGFSNCICSLFFIDAPKTDEWECALIFVTYQGTLQRFLLSNSTYKEEHTFAFSRFHMSGVASVTFSSKHNIFLVAGFDGEEPSLEEKDFAGARAGITLWRELSDFPYYTMIDTDDVYSKRISQMGKLKNLVNIPWQKSKEFNHRIYKCCLSPSEETLITLHQDGRISLWRMPSLKLEKTWSLSEQPSFDQESGAYFFEGKPKIEEDANLQKQFINVNWWSEKAVICARGSGAISVSSTASLENLLGQSEEMFEPWPCTTNASDGQFLVLECEKKLKVSGEANVLKKNENDPIDHEEDEDDTFVSKLSKIVKQTLYFLTESENLRPTSRKLRLVQRVYRLIALQSTTPEELYSRKISHEEYGEALELARRFKLDTDLVYQRQWTNQVSITVISIKDYLSKITNRFWVLNECMQRVPEDIDAMKHLLQYGLLGTDIHVLQRIETDEKLPFVLAKEADLDDGKNDAQSEDEAAEKQISEVIDVESLTTKQILLCRYRWQILQYLDRLETYEVILGGPFRAAERYKPDFFLQFRCCNIIDQAVDYARTSCSEPLEELFSFHGEDLLPHWLAILSNFPETTPVSSYKRLLPVLQRGESGKAVLGRWPQSKHRDPDWAEAASLKRHVINQTDIEEDQAAFIYQEKPYLDKFRSCVDPDLLTEWFKLRAHEIESRTSLVDNAISLIDHGIRNGVQGLAEIRDDLKWLGTLVYEVIADPSIGLADFEKLSDLAKMRLLMSKSTEESFLRDYMRWGKSFIDFVGKTKPENQWKLQKKYFIDVAKSDLTFPLMIFEKSIPGSDEPLIADVANLMRLAIDCIYICKRDDQLDIAFKIVECLPTREESQLSSQIDDLHDKVDQLEQLLRGAEIMDLYSIPKPISFLVDTKGDTSTAREILTNLCRNVSRRQPSLNPNQWNLFLKHVQQLREEVYDCIPVAELYQLLETSAPIFIYVDEDVQLDRLTRVLILIDDALHHTADIFIQYLLNSGIEDNLYLAKELMAVSKQKPKDGHLKSSNLKAVKVMPRLTNATFRVSYDESVNLVLEAAKEYFNAGAHFTDSTMELARKCLGIIEDNSSLLQYELDLLAALAILNDFDVTILPVQVRLYEDKLDLLRLAIESVSAGYKKTAKIHKLAKLLQISGLDEKERVGKVTNLLAEIALKYKDLSFAKEMCLSLIDSNYASGWTVCRTLCEEEKFLDLEAKQKLVAFALTFCSPDEIEQLLTARNLIDTQIVYSELSKQEVNSSDTEEMSDTAERSLDDVDGQAPSSLLGRTQQQLKSKTKAMISNVSDTEWWKSQVKWVSHSNGSKSLKSKRNGTQEDHCGIYYHPFYAAQEHNGIDSEMNLENIFDTTDDNPARIINTLLLRSQKLCESRAEGTISEPSTEGIYLYLQATDNSLVNNPSIPCQSNYVFHTLAFYDGTPIFIDIKRAIANNSPSWASFLSQLVLLQLAELELYHDTVMFLGYLLSLGQLSDADELLSKYHGDPLVLQLAAYGLSVELQARNKQSSSDSLSPLYLQDALDVIKNALKSTDVDSDVRDGKLVESLRKYLRLLSDFVQAKTLEDLGKGVDIERFMQDDEYKRETILGIAMNLEEELLSTAISLAEKYDLPAWEVICAHVEFLLTDSGLKFKEIQERLTKLDVVHTLRDNGAGLLEKMKLYVYPYIRGNDHALLLLLFNLIQQCCGDDAIIEGSMDVASHIRSLKKIKSAAPGMDYKELVDGARPLETVKTVLMESNVHVLAKLVPKINGGDLGKTISSGEIFAAFIGKLFWDSDQKKDEAKIQWLHRFESCQKYFPKLSPKDVMKFTDDITLNDRAVDNLTQDVRLNIAKRVLKYVRQQKAQEEKQSHADEESESKSIEYAAVESHLERSLIHIQNLEAAWFLQWFQSKNEKEREYARRFDISQSDLAKIAEFAKDLFLDLRTPEEVLDVYKAGDKEAKHKLLVADSFKEALSCVIHNIKTSKDFAAMEKLTDMIDVVNDHLQNGGHLLSQEDVLNVVRPLCADLEVKTELKMDLLQLLERSFKLSGDDIFLLIFYQTDAIISSSWNKKISPEDIDSDEKRCQLFHDLIEDSRNANQIYDIGQLLLVWPILAAIELSEHNPDQNPWIILLKKLIGYGDSQRFLELIKQSSSKFVIGLECYTSLQDTLLVKGFKIEALKMALVSNNDKCFENAYQLFAGANADDSCIDNELFGLIAQTKTVKDLVKTSLYPSFLDYVMKHSDNEIMFNDVLNQLKVAGLAAEAGTLISRQSNIHQALSTIDVALNSFKNWFQK